MQTYEFQDGEFQSAAEKQKVLKAWVAFLKSGCAKEKFTKALYDHLHLHLPFIAHYSQQVFYNTYFERGDDTVRFFQTVKDFVVGPMSNMRNRDYDDINHALIDALKQYERPLVEAAKAKQKAADLAAADKLLARYGMQRRQPGEE